MCCEQEYQNCNFLVCNVRLQTGLVRKNCCSCLQRVPLISYFFNVIRQIKHFQKPQNVKRQQLKAKKQLYSPGKLNKCLLEVKCGHFSVTATSNLFGIPRSTLSCKLSGISVSYTHLTLPTIYSV